MYDKQLDCFDDEERIYISNQENALPAMWEPYYTDWGVSHFEKENIGGIIVSTNCESLSTMYGRNVMKNMYAVKCLYQFKFYSMENELLEDVMPGWEERIILIKAASMEDADSKCEKMAKEYESEYTNPYNQIVKVRLYTIVDIFATFDTTARTNIEVYSNMFDATEEEVEKMLDVEYPIEE